MDAKYWKIYKDKYENTSKRKWKDVLKEKMEKIETIPELLTFLLEEDFALQNIVKLQEKKVSLNQEYTICFRY